MSRLAVPLVGRFLWATGDFLLHARLELLLHNRSGAWKQAPFRVDSGTEMTSMPASFAKTLDLPYPQNPTPGFIHPGSGGVLRAGVIRAKVVGMDATEYVFPCFFLGDPDAPPANQPGPLSMNLLGLTGVVDKIRITLDGSPAPGAPNGNLIVEKL